MRQPRLPLVVGRRRLLASLLAAAAAMAPGARAVSRAWAQVSGAGDSGSSQALLEPEFQRFNEEALRVLFFARRAVSEVGGPSVTCAHILIGVTHVDPALLNAVLAEGWDAVRLRTRMSALLQASPRLPLDAEVPFSAGALRALQRATLKLATDDQATPAHVFVSALSERQELERIDAVLREAGVRVPAAR
jgi:hypothetical protein